MSDDMWSRDEEGRRRAPLFGDDEPTTQSEQVDDDPFGDDDAAGEAGRRRRERAPDDAAEADDEPLSFGEGDTGPLPHWTEPPTGEMPQLEARPPAADDPPLDDELDVWSSFTSESPVWRDDVPADPSGEVPQAGSGQHVTGQHDPISGEVTGVAPREPARITIGTDPSGMPRRPVEPTGRAGARSRRASAADGQRAAPASSGRDMPVAVAVGLLLAAVFIGALLWRPVAVLAVIVAVVGLGAIEFYDKVAEKGYRPAVVPGILACVSAPLAAYWLGPVTIPLVIAFAFMASAGGFIGARSIEAGPLPNVSVTMLGVIWIGLLGSFAALILQFSTGPGSPPFGTDTLFLLALGVVANDIGAFFVGSAAGRTPLREWISPSKTVEGLIGGTLFTIVVLVVVGITEVSDTWTNTSHLLILALVISVFAPMGDLVESMFKRNLDIKDFGSIVKGHGGVLDRFDGFLFTLPIVYYVTLVLEPWLG